MADQRILSTEKMVGAGHATLADTINRLVLVEHNNDGTHKFGKLFAAQHVAATLTGNTNETTLFSVVIPANTLGPNGVLEITSLFTVPNGSGANKTVKVKFGGTAFFQYTVGTGIGSIQNKVMVRNRNSASSQVAAAAGQLYSFGYPATGVLVSAIDTTIDQTLAVTGQLANAADSITLEDVFAEVLRP